MEAIEPIERDASASAWSDALSRRRRRKSEKFWARQFARETTPEQALFDLTFGLMVPLLCLLFDPIVFSGRGSAFADRQILPEWRLPAYMIIAMTGVAMIIRLRLIGLVDEQPVSGLIMRHRASDPARSTRAAEVFEATTDEPIGSYGYWEGW